MSCEGLGGERHTFLQVHLSTHVIIYTGTYHRYSDKIDQGERLVNENVSEHSTFGFDKNRHAVCLWFRENKNFAFLILSKNLSTKRAGRKMNDGTTRK